MKSFLLIACMALSSPLLAERGKIMNEIYSAEKLEEKHYKAFNELPIEVAVSSIYKSNEFKQKERDLIMSLPKQSVITIADMLNALQLNEPGEARLFGILAAKADQYFDQLDSEQRKEVISSLQKKLEDSLEDGAYLTKKDRISYLKQTKFDVHLGEIKRALVKNRTSNQALVKGRDFPVQERVENQNVRNNAFREPKTNSSSRLPWIIAGVLLVGILALLFKVFREKSTS